MDNVRVLYISPVASPFGISRYKYYNLIIDGDKFSIIGDDGEISEYTKDTIQEYYRLEIGEWEDYFKSIKDVKITPKKISKEK